MESYHNPDYIKSETHELPGECLDPKEAPLMVTKRPTLLITVDKTKRTATIQLTRPERSNSFVPETYTELSKALNDLDANDDVTAVLLTGSGLWYSSGYDLDQIREGVQGEVKDEEMREHFKKMVKEQAWTLVEALIKFSKPLIAAVNGPAIGIAVTTLALCDIVYASKTATFHTPFAKFGLSPEGCASLLFPTILGTSKANEMLLLGNMATAEEFESRGFVARVFPDDTFQEEVAKRFEQLASYPRNALIQTKALTRGPMKERLLEVNKKELTLLVDRFVSSESIAAVHQFLQEEKKKKQSKL